MTRTPSLIMLLAGVTVIGGCRIATRVTEVPRADLRLEGGNRGYVVGSPPEAAELDPTREMVSTEIEIPSLYRSARRDGAATVEGIAPPETDSLEEGEARGGVTVVGGQAHGTYGTYVVQKGDSLWSIAAKLEIYGKATRWRRIFDANRDQLKSPDSLKAGMTLKIPGGDDLADDEGTSFRK